MPALNQDTRLIMTILFVGSISGANVYFYANYGNELPWTPLSHAVLFGLITVGAVMGMKAIFDLAANDRIEGWLLDRRIRFYWEKQQREESQRRKIKESMGLMPQQPFQQSPIIIQQQPDYDETPNEFLKSIKP
tara:strand:- start:2784 stop:3185 length:402 start_codon:yes stop_codon:yes gene_type:complete